ncbi:hypothetical protein KKA47_05185, partial [bacterium]|nr:hypothetical protein [bacterium]
DKKDLISLINDLKRRYLLAIKTDLESRWKGVQALKGQIKDPSLRFSDLLIHLDNLAQRLAYSMQVAIDNRSANLIKLISNLEHLSPLHILSKGYAVVKRHGEGGLLKSTKGLKIGDILDVKLNNGEIESKITKVID